MPRDLSKAIVASPNQASSVFGVGGAHPIRQKSLFVMRFLRRVGDGGEDWKNGMTFLVKTTDRPSVQPAAEELNQYNKKRVIHTSVKYNPVTCTIYDTADGAVQLMWAQYASYYFGDYRQEPSAYGDDIINERMNGDSFGYGIATTSASEPQGINSQFFFDTVEVYQVWGGEYTAYQLLRPKITSFTPDELSYEDSSPSTVSITLQFEGIFHENGGKPQRISQNETLTAMFGGEFSGETYDPVGAIGRQTDFTSTSEPANSSNSTGQLARLLSAGQASNVTTPEKSSNTTSAGGALSRFGTFDFGDFKTIGSTLPSEISSIVSNHEVANAALGGDYSSIPDVGVAINQAAKIANNSPLDHAKHNNSYLANYEEDSWAYPYPGPDSSVMPSPAAVDARVYIPRHRRKRGLSLSPVALAALNSRSDGTSQLGQRTNSNSLLGFLNEPTPARALDYAVGFGRAYLKVNASIIAMAVAIGGRIQTQVTITSTIIANAVKFSGTINRPIPIRALLDGFVNNNITTDPNSVGLSGDASDGDDLLLLSGDEQDDGDDTLNYSGDYDGE